MNIEAVTQRAIDLHEKAFMPLSQALELALSEAAPSPIWPCAKLVIRGGKVTAESHQYAPGLPDGEHDVYPLPVDSDAEPAPSVPEVSPVKHWCETCEGLGTIDETLGGEHFSNPKATCPDCDGQGWWTPRTSGVLAAGEAQQEKRDA